MAFERTFMAAGVLTAAVLVAACGSSSSGSPQSSSSSGGDKGSFGSCTITSKADTIKVTPVQAGVLTVEVNLPAQGWWNGTTADSIKDGYEYCMAAELANMAGLTSVAVRNVSFDQLVAGRTNTFDIALSEISITAERAKVVNFSTPYFDSNIGVLVKNTSNVSETNIGTSTCGAIAGTTSVSFIQDKLKCNAKVYPSTQPLYQAVISGQVDAGFLDTAIVLAEAKNVPALKVVGQYSTGEKYGAIYPKGSTNQNALDGGIKTLIDDGSLKTLSTKYLGPAFGGDPSSIPVWTVK